MNKSEEKIYELLKSNVLFRDEKGIYTIFPQKLLIEASGKSERTVRYTLRSLEEQKYITREIHKEINLVKFYFLQEEKLKNTHIIDRRKNCPSPSENCHTLPNNTSINSDKLSSSANNSLKTDENDTPDKELPKIEKTTVPESVLYPLWKPTYEIFNNFPIGKTKKLNMESEKDRRKGKTANLLMLLNFDELKGVQISRTLTIYDKNVWNACANLVKCGYGTVTAAQIYKFMGHTSEPPTSERNKILESISTISRARVYVSNKEEHELYKKYDEILLDTPLLAAEICQAKFGDDIVEEAIRIIEPLSTT